MNEKTSKLAQRGFRALAAFVAAALILTCVPPTFRASAAAEPATGAFAQPSEAGFAHDGPSAAGAASADDAASEPAEDAAPALGDDAASTDAGVAPDAPEDAPSASDASDREANAADGAQANGSDVPEPSDAASSEEPRAAEDVCTLVGVGGFPSLQEAIDSVAPAGRGVIEMNVSSYTLQDQVKVASYKGITITTAPGVDSCVFTMDKRRVGGLALFSVSGKAELVFDGTRNGRDGSQANGIVLGGLDEGKDGEAQGQRGVDVYEGYLTLNDATIRNFSADFGSTAGVRAVGINASRSAVQLKGSSLVTKCSMFGGGGVKEDCGGVAVYGDTQFSDMPTDLLMEPGATISECSGVTGGLVVSNWATATIRGTIERCSTYDGTVHRCAGGIFMSQRAKVTLENATIRDNRAATGTPGVTPCAGGIWVEGGQLAIHGATITGNTSNAKNTANPNGAGGVGMNIQSLSSDVTWTRLALSGKVVIRDNRIDDGRTQTNLTLAKGGVSFMHYLVIDDDLEPGSYVGITAQGGGKTARYAEGEAFGVSAVTSEGLPAADKYLGAADYSGDAKAIANLNCLVNDRDERLRGLASWDGWKSPGFANAGQAKKTLPDAPEAIVWARSYDVKVQKQVDAPEGLVTGVFPFTVQTAGASFSGEVYDRDGSPTGRTVAAHGTPENFELSDGQYVLFANVTSLGSGSAGADVLSVEERGGASSASADRTQPFSCEAAGRTDAGRPIGDVDAGRDGSVRWQGDFASLLPGDGNVTVTFTNALRTGGLEVSTSVEGDYADAAKAFSFELTLQTPSFANADSEFGAYVTGGATGASGARYTFVSGRPTSFSLKAGETLVFDGLPVGTTYALLEQPSPLYRASAEVSTVDAQGDAVQASVAEGDAGAGLAFSYGEGGLGVSAARIAQGGPGTNTAHVVNRVPDAPATGVAHADAGLPAALVAGSVAVAALLAGASVGLRALRRRRA